MAAYSTYTDQELVVLLKKDDQAAFTEVHRRYYALLFNNAHTRLGDKDEAADILQELFGYLWINRVSIHVTSSLRAYLFVSLRNRVINAFAKEKVRSDYADSLQNYQQNWDYQTDEAVRRTELLSMIDREVEQLPPRMRKVFEMSRYDQMSHAEIAEILNTSPQTVKKQMQNVLKILKVRLSDRQFLFLF